MITLFIIFTVLLISALLVNTVAFDNDLSVATVVVSLFVTVFLTLSMCICMISISKTSADDEDFFQRAEVAEEYQISDMGNNLYLDEDKVMEKMSDGMLVTKTLENVTIYQSNNIKKATVKVYEADAYYSFWWIYPSQTKSVVCLPEGAGYKLKEEERHNPWW